MKTEESARKLKRPKKKKSKDYRSLECLCLQVNRETTSRGKYQKSRQWVEGIVSIGGMSLYRLSRCVEPSTVQSRSCGVRFSLRISFIVLRSPACSIGSKEFSSDEAEY